MRRLLLLVSHGLALALGFALGIYALPILTAPAAPSAADVQAQATQASYKGTFRRELKDSDLLHWGEGTVSVGPRSITLMGKLAPGPDYKLYLSPEFVETEVDFAKLKPSMVRVGELTGRLTNSRHSLHDFVSQRSATKASSTSPSVTITCAIAVITATVVPGLSCRW